MSACPFCRETAGSTEVVEVLDDVYPSAPGHKLIVPTRHVARVVDLTGPERHGLMRWLGLLTAFNRDAGDGYTIGINDGAAAGQTVPHVHMHVIPRHHGDVPDARGGVRWVLPTTAAYWDTAA